MNAYLDALGQWLQSLGVHPVLGSFLLGAAIAFVLAYRGSTDVAQQFNLPPTQAGDGTVSRLPGFAHAFQGRTISIPDEVMELLDSGRQIEAMKALRQALGIGLKEAKDIVDTLPRRSS
jgi:hypothetical protein